MKRALLFSFQDCKLIQADQGGCGVQQGGQHHALLSAKQRPGPGVRQNTAHSGIIKSIRREK